MTQLLSLFFLYKLLSKWWQQLGLCFMLWVLNTYQLSNKHKKQLERSEILKSKLVSVVKETKLTAIFFSSCEGFWYHFMHFVCMLRCLQFDEYLHFYGLIPIVLGLSGAMFYYTPLHYAHIGFCFLCEIFFNF